MRTPTGTLLRAGLTAVVSLALVAGCTDDPKPGTLKTPTASPTSTSASPTPTTPEAQIEAAVRAYYAELTRAAQTNDTSKLTPMVTPGCPCFRTVRGINQARAAGRTTPDVSWTIDSLHVHDVEKGTGHADVEYTVSAYEELNAKAKVVADYPQSQSQVDLS
jgi:hypothetical protein